MKGIVGRSRFYEVEANLNWMHQLPPPRSTCVPLGRPFLPPSGLPDCRHACPNIGAGFGSMLMCLPSNLVGFSGSLGVGWNPTCSFARGRGVLYQRPNTPDKV